MLHWLQNRFSLWSGLFCHRPHRVGRELLVFVISVVCTVGIAITDCFVVVGHRVCLTSITLTIIVVTGAIFVGVILVSLFLELTTLVSVRARLFALMTCRFRLLRM